MGVEEIRKKQAEVVKKILERLEKNESEHEIWDNQNLYNEICNLELDLLKSKYDDNGKCLINFVFGELGSYGITRTFSSGKSTISINCRELEKNFKDKPREMVLKTLETIFHELNHYEQQLIMQSKDNYSMESLIMAEEQILKEYTENMTNRGYNYTHQLHEIDSRIVAINKIAELNSELLSLSDGKIGFSDEELEEYDLINDRKTSETYFRDTMMYNGRQFIVEENNQISLKDIAKKELLDRFMSEHPEKLELYPVLNLKYDKNGARRTLTDMYNLYNQKNGQSENINNILLECLTESFEDASEQEFIDFENQGENAKEIYVKLKEYNNKKLKERLRDIKDLNEENPKYTITMYKRRLTALDYAIQGQYNLVKKINQKDIEDIINEEFAKELMEGYSIMESNAQYDERAEFEEKNMANIRGIIENQTKYHSADLANMGIISTVNENGEKEFHKEAIISMARLLKASENLTMNIELNGIHSTNFFEEFCDLPEVAEILKEMRNSVEAKKLLKYAEITRKNGDRGRGTYRGPTPGEADKDLVKEYFESGDKKEDKQLILYGKVKEDLISASINSSEIKGEFKEFEQKIKGTVRDGKVQDDENHNR